MFRTFNQWLAAYLHARGVPVEAEIIGGWTRYSVDTRDPDARDALRDWHAGKATVLAHAYADAFKDVVRMARGA